MFSPGMPNYVVNAHELLWYFKDVKLFTSYFDFVLYILMGGLENFKAIL